MKIIKWSIATLILLILVVLLTLFLTMRASLPELDARIENSEINENASLSRDTLGTAIIHASSEYDAAYLLGYAHAQDRLFQIDLLRRQSAGELSELVGSAALNLDKKHRVHQFRKRAEAIFNSLPHHQKKLLTHYSQGVNAAAQSLVVKPFEYFLVNADFTPWQETDSLLATYSMYIDLQLAQTEIDFRLTVLKELFGKKMHNFFTLPSNYQAAIDNSIVPLDEVDIPNLQEVLDNLANNNDDGITDNHTHQLSNEELSYYDAVLETADIGSNNWAVSGNLTVDAGAMLSNDMHLGLRVPAIWYRTQLNYSVAENNKKTQVSVTGVSLPGTPAVIVGSNGNIAWGFTNSNVDNVDWVALSDASDIEVISELINTPDGPETFTFETSKIGPIRAFNGKKYALKWVAHQDYAVNMRIADLAKKHSVEDGLALATNIRIPVQNMVIADAQGNVAWQLTGAITGRAAQKRHAIDENELSENWERAESSPANMVNPEHGRIWSANARVISANDLARYGNGGYALGARQQQIMQALMQKSQFTEQDFYAIQLDNRALFLEPWHRLLLQTLETKPQKYKTDINILQQWDACACKDEIAYTLVRRFRSGVINTLLAPINSALKKYDMSTSYLLRSIEPAIWQLLQNQTNSWLSDEYKDYNALLLSSYDKTKDRLMTRYGATNSDMTPLAWGNVNQLTIKHPFSKQLSFMSNWLDMPLAAGFGDSYMPAVQSVSFGASQRLIVRPGSEQDAILTIPGGQSGHFLSDFYRSGYSDYVGQQNTSLLPGKEIHRLEFIAQ